MKRVTGFEGYSIRKDGLVYSHARRVKLRGDFTKWIEGRFLKYKTDTCGYKCVELSNGTVKQTFKIHRLIAMAYIPNPDNKPSVNHKNGIKHDNRVENLEWCTQKENIQHAFNTGLHSHKGERNTKAKLTETQVSIIRSQINSGMRGSDIARLYGVSKHTVSHIKVGRTWTTAKMTTN